MRKLLIVLAAALAGACQTAGGQPARPFYTLVNLTDEYVAYYDRTEGVESAARVTAFKAEMDPYFPGFYDTARVQDFISADGYNQLIARSFDDFPELRERFLRTATNFEAMLEPARESFSISFPDLDPLGEVYLLHSVGEMDGGTRSINGRTHLVFGADVMARLYQPGQERAFFHHELFHVYHSQFFEGCEQLWCGLWREGLATHIAHHLNPDATDLELLLTSPRPIRPEIEADRTRAVCAVRARLHSTSNDDVAALFGGNRNLDGLPPRAGYYIGYLAAREAGRTHTPQELAHLSVAEAGPLVEAALASLAECP